MIKSLCTATMLRMRQRFNRLYGPARADHCLERIAAMVGRYGVGYGIPPASRERWSERTSVLITYADTVRRADEAPLKTLKHFLDRHLREAIDTVHVLPFFPYSSDDGFSITDYRAVHRDHGDWGDLRALGRDYGLMFDLVLNHVSRKSEWFRDYRNGVAPLREFFIESDPDADLSAVVRPRSKPLLHPVKTVDGEKHVWTTFSEDQIDLDFSNPDVLFEFLDLVLFYLSQGARILRLDAIAYLWKVPGTPCIHLPQTHATVKLIRDLLDMVAPEALILTETNVPHEENLSYFGDGDEAHMVYQFSLPPLLLHALRRETGKHLTAWAAGLPELPEGQTFFNFTASHDGIGLRPLQGLLDDAELALLVDDIRRLGGHVSTRRREDGTDSPYELNIALYDALGDPDRPDEEAQIRAFLCAQTLPLALRGVPALYFHSFTATRNYTEGVEATGRARTINRYRWDEDDLTERLADPRSRTTRVLDELRRRLKLRARQPAFHPDSPQRVVDLGPECFALVRGPFGKGPPVAALSNLTARTITVRLDPAVPELNGPRPCVDLLSGTRFSGSAKEIELAPRQTVWLARR
ncbi:sugar phosphorylase [Kiritimatiella glycovorans]|uniref:Sucrose phosphorylase n=1 Tax=Kiritimatiella glycovorans TaxID=1307763 RepID=A0A0G3EIX5_9BACT|nr:sugar phosphorylase [Kiritimatiella glycovorans]AKJ65362.1 Sucrose phosphorylase [Kiritimatiella glycovorans]